MRRHRRLNFPSFIFVRTSNVLNKEDPLFIFTALLGVIGESIVDHASELQSENSVEVLIESVKEVDLSLEPVAYFVLNDR